MSTETVSIPPAAVRPEDFKEGMLMAENPPIDYVKLLSGLVLAMATVVGSLGLYIAKGALARQDAMQARQDSMEARQQAVDLWIAETKSNRFTSSDGTKLWQAIADGQRDMVKLQTELSMNNAQLRDSMVEMKATLRSVDERIRSMEKKP